MRRLVVGDIHGGLKALEQENGFDFRMADALARTYAVLGETDQVRRYVDISEVSDRVKEIYEQVLPHYEHMKQYRLQA